MENQPLLGQTTPIYIRTRKRRNYCLYMVLGIFAYFFLFGKSVTIKPLPSPGVGDWTNEPLRYESSRKPISLVTKFGIECSTELACFCKIVTGDQPSYSYKIRSRSKLDLDDVTVNYDEQSQVLTASSDRVRSDDRASVELKIVLPSGYFDFNMMAKIGSLKWDGVSDGSLGKPVGHPRQSLFMVHVNVGSVTVREVIRQKIDLDVDTGSITLDNSRAEVASVHTNVGDISSVGLRSIDSKFNIKTGSIAVKNIESNRLEAHTNVGSVKIDSLAQSNSFSTNTGSINAIVTNYNNLKAHSSLGDVRLELYPLASSLTDASVSAGSIKASLLDFEGSFDLETDIGSLKVYGDFEKNEEDNGMFSKKLKGKVGQGNGEFHAKSGLGDIKITFNKS